MAWKNFNVKTFRAVHKLLAQRTCVVQLVEMRAIHSNRMCIRERNEKKELYHWMCVCVIVNRAIHTVI